MSCWSTPIPEPRSLNAFDTNSWSIGLSEPAMPLEVSDTITPGWEAHSRRYDFAGRGPTPQPFRPAADFQGAPFNPGRAGPPASWPNRINYAGQIW